MSKNKKKLPEAPQHPLPTPRTMEEINKVYQELCQRAGEVQYRLVVMNAELDKLNEALFNINTEGAARQAVDAKEKANASA